MQTSQTPNKWYNHKLKLALSLLIWPLFIYGVYKSSLLSKNFKYAIYGFVALIFLMNLGDNGGSSADRGPKANAPSWQSQWDASVPAVKRYIKRNLNDPGSYESVKWDWARKNEDGTYTVWHTFSAKNAFGGRVKETMTFKVSADGKTVLSAY